MGLGKRPAAMRLALINIVVTVGSIAFFLGIFEIVVRTSGFDYKKSTDEYLARKFPGCVSDNLKVNSFSNILLPDQRWKYYASDSVLFWKLRPNKELDVNSDGFRGDVITRHKAPGTFRILALGDSCTFGWSVRAKESYPQVLQLLLRARGGQAYEIVNAGVPGYSSYQVRLLYQDKLQLYSPDVLIVFVGANDVALNMVSDKERYVLPEVVVDAEAYLMQYVWSYAFMKYGIMKMMFGHGLTMRVTYEDHLKNLEEIKAAAVGRKIPVYFISPVWRKAEGGMIKNPMLDETPFIDLYAILEKAMAAEHVKVEELILDDGVHLTPLGHKILAQAIMDRLVTDKVIQ